MNRTIIESEKIITLYNEINDINSLINLLAERCEEYKDYDLSFEGWNRFAFQLKRLDKDEEALKVFHWLLKKQLDNFDLHHSLGLMYTKLDQKEKAIDCFEKSLVLNPDIEQARKDLEILKQSS